MRKTSESAASARWVAGNPAGMDSWGVVSPEALRPHLSMGLPLKQPESSDAGAGDLRTASRDAYLRVFSRRHRPAEPPSLIIVMPVVAECRRNGRIAPVQASSAETAHPLRGGVAKPRVSPQWEDCRVTEQVRCPVTGRGALRQCWIPRSYCGDGILRPRPGGPQACVCVRRRRDPVEGGGGVKRTRWKCSAGEWGAATAAPFFICQSNIGKFSPPASPCRPVTA
jgi:hypothetical protein